MHAFVLASLEGRLADHLVMVPRHGRPNIIHFSWSMVNSSATRPVSREHCPKHGTDGWVERWHSNRHAFETSLGRNLRSKTQWFAEFCNSHYVSHFAAFFIIVRAKISVAESCLLLFKVRFPLANDARAPGEAQIRSVKHGAWRICKAKTRLAPTFTRRRTGHERVELTLEARKVDKASSPLEGAREWSTTVRAAPHLHVELRRTKACSQGLLLCVCNDPSAGSPTETLLWLLLPLNDKV